MTNTNAEASAADPIAVIRGAEGAAAQMSIAEAARAVSEARRPQNAEDGTTELRPHANRSGADRAREAEGTEQSPAAEPATAAASGETDEAGEREAPPGETERASPADELPPIAPPRSWTKADKELFASLPRETQERLAERERSRDSDLSQRQQKATELARALDSERAQMEEARRRYESALPEVLHVLEAQQASDFSDIKSMADVEKLAREDWARYLQWDVAQKKLGAVRQEMLSAQHRREEDRRQQFSRFAGEQDALFAERVPEMAEPEKAAKLQGTAVAVLRDLGFGEGELTASWNGEKDLSLRDHRMQLLIRDATLWREAQQKARAAATRPVPPVQRPGMAQDRNAGIDAEIRQLSRQLETATGMQQARIAAKLVAARRAAAR